MLVSAVEGYRLWAPAYDTEANPLVWLEDRAPSEMIGDVSGLRVVDVACGTGRWTARLTAAGARVVGFDLSPEMVARAVHKPGIAGRLGLADAACLPIAPESADLVLCSLALGYFEDLDRAFGEFARVVRAGGRVVVSDLHPARTEEGSTRSFSAGGVVYDVRFFRYSVADMLRAARRAGLQLQCQRDVCFGPPEEDLAQQAGHIDFFLRNRHIPAIWAASWTKP